MSKFLFATASAAVDVSVATTFAFGFSLAYAAAIAPLPVPASATVRGFWNRLLNSLAISTNSSVSGLGIKTSLVTIIGRDQNSEHPVI